jgi:hypothetical protein
MRDGLFVFGRDADHGFTLARAIGVFLQSRGLIAS